MTETIPDKALVLVADGGKALLLRRTGSGHVVTLREERKLTPDTLHEQGPAGARPQEQTEKQTAEASFVNRLGHVLHTMHGQGDFKDLVLVADPQTLGQLRAALHKNVEKTVVRSLSKDLTNHSVEHIAEALST